MAGLFSYTAPMNAYTLRIRNRAGKILVCTTEHGATWQQVVDRVQCKYSDWAWTVEVAFINGKIV